MKELLGEMCKPGVAGAMCEHPLEGVVEYPAKTEYKKNPRLGRG